MSREKVFAIIEHPTRGTLREFDQEFDGTVKARFSTSGMRNDPEKTMIFYSIVEAFEALEKIPTPAKWESAILVYNPTNISYYKLVKV